MPNKQYILSKGQAIDSYTMQFFLKKGDYAETYRVLDKQKNIRFLKLFDYNKLHRTQIIENGEVLEIEILKQLNHPNVVKYRDCGTVIIESKKYAYVVLDFISGETLANKISRENKLNPYQAKQIILGVLNGLSFLHQKGIIHNDITNLNVMLDLSGQIEIPKIIDFGYARYFQQSINEFQNEGLNTFYTANEGFNKVFSYHSDIFSVGALYYHLLEEMPPWFVDISKYKSDKLNAIETILSERQKPLKFSNSTDAQTQEIIRKALQPNAENRFDSVKQFIKAVNGELKVELSQQSETKPNVQPQKIKKGQGFSSIAGMNELKETIRLDVIDALNEKERYAEYGLSIPNGMLLYGPPGCGKTFFAEKLAEEIGFTFYQIKPSDIQSKWVNASQENIKNLFDEAKENAPSIIFIDELDALVPSRDNSSVSHMNTSAVNEFLAQMNNCGEDGIFVIGATNRPLSIDPAILRAGRLDKKVYVPVPDFEARKALFKLYLKKRPIEIGMDYQELSNITENYASVDIKNICDESARQALKNKDRISFKLLVQTIRNTRPSSTQSELAKYQEIKIKMEGGETESNKRNRIGFK